MSKKLAVLLVCAVVSFHLAASAPTEGETGHQCACPYNYAPVCGSDGVTHPNERCMICANPSLSVRSVGRCPEDVEKTHAYPVSPATNTVSLAAA